MADASISVDKDRVTCPVCLEPLKDPMSLLCGHSFCKVCISKCWDQEAQKGAHSCPECRETFTPRPAPRRNIRMEEVLEKLNKTEIQVASPTHSHAGHDGMECDFCTGRKHKAVKHCLVCAASLCETHLKPHLEHPGIKHHTLIEVSAELPEKIRPEHEAHGTDPVPGAEKESDPKDLQMKFQKRIQEKQKEVQELKQAVDTIKLSAQTAVEDNEIIFTEMISYLEKKRSEVTELIRAQKEAEVSRAERLLEQLEQEIADLQKRVSELEELSHTHDHIHFLQSFASGRRSPPFLRPDFRASSITEQHLSFEGVRNSVSALKKRLEEFCHEEFRQILPHAAAVDISYPREPQSREEFLKYYSDLILDPNTAHHNLILSPDNRAVTYSEKNQRYSEHPLRFYYWPQVLSKGSVCGRCYWEVEWNGDDVSIAVSYKDISRKGRGNECVFGGNDQSWSLQCSSSSVYFYHNNVKTDLEVPASPRIGVYVDHSAGILSFYGVSDTMKLLYRVHTTFTQPLYAGFGFYWYYGYTVRFCDPMQQVQC